MSDSFFGGIILFMVAALLVIGFGLGALVSSDASRHLLENQGFTSIQLEQKHIFVVELRGCSDEDNARFDYSAINPRGKRVNVQVCDGIIKGATIRG